MSADGRAARLAQVQLVGDGGGGQGVVAGDHLHLDAGRVAGLDGLHGLRPRRVDHALQPQEDKTRLHVLVGDLVGVGRQVLAGEGQHPQTLGGHLHGQPLDPPASSGLREPSSLSSDEQRASTFSTAPLT